MVPVVPPLCELNESSPPTSRPLPRNDCVCNSLETSRVSVIVPSGLEVVDQLATAKVSLLSDDPCCVNDNTGVKLGSRLWPSEIVSVNTLFCRAKKSDTWKLTE